MVKLRGVRTSGGWHDSHSDRHRRAGGLPRLVVAAEHPGLTKLSTAPSGIPELDLLLGGGIDRGTSMLIMGPAGSGKTSIGMQFALAAAARGENSAMFLFDEQVETLMTRSRGIGMKMREAFEQKRISMQQIDPAQMPPGEFVQLAVKHKPSSATRQKS